MIKLCSARPDKSTITLTSLDRTDVLTKMKTITSDICIREEEVQMMSKRAPSARAALVQFNSMNYPTSQLETYSTCSSDLSVPHPSAALCCCSKYHRNERLGGSTNKFDLSLSERKAYFLILLLGWEQLPTRAKGAVTFPSDRDCDRGRLMTSPRFTRIST